SADAKPFPAEALTPGLGWAQLKAEDAVGGSPRGLDTVRRSGDPARGAAGNHRGLGSARPAGGARPAAPGRVRIPARRAVRRGRATVRRGGEPGVAGAEHGARGRRGGRLRAARPPFLRGDVVLVPFRYSGPAGQKERPAVVLSTDVYHDDWDELLVVAVTSRPPRAVRP